jgi:undecaprenyl diphosphate synthase
LSLAEDVKTRQLPAHIAIIMDGNGRWAKKRLMNRIKGHEKGAESVRNVVKACREIGIPHLTLYAFSTENWQRPRAEVDALMVLLKKFLKEEKKELIYNNIRLNTIGQTEKLPGDVQAALRETMAATSHNKGLWLHLALSYGGRAEIVRMVQKIMTLSLETGLKPEAVDSNLVGDHLYTRDIPDPDLLIRTSGEMRISNFLLWQIAYTEIFVTNTLWPDFGKKELLEIIKSYQERDRRFGKVANDSPVPTHEHR